MLFPEILINRWYDKLWYQLSGINVYLMLLVLLYLLLNYIYYLDCRELDLVKGYIICQQFLDDLIRYLIYNYKPTIECSFNANLI